MKTLQKIVEASALIAAEGGVSKVGYNREQKYSYRRAEDVFASVNKALVKTGLAVWPESVEFLSGDVTQTKSGSRIAISTIRVTYRVRATEGDDNGITVISVGCGSDTMDKGPAKAMTMAYKIAMGQLFSIPFEATDAEEPVEEDDGPPEELLARAKEAASKGLGQYQVFFLALTKEERLSLQSVHESLKQAAQEADAKQTVEQTPQANTPRAKARMGE